MRRAGWIVLIAMLSGCAARTAPGRIISTDWATVMGPRGAAGPIETFEERLVYIRP
jgi:hypothetical protein